ncbi:MAG: hypothetical protein WD595_05440 [Waddliaceae bacterium]
MNGNAINGDTPNVDPTMGVSPSAETQEEAKFVNPALLSSIMQSQAQEILENLTASSPQIASPQQISALMSSAENNIISKMLDSWLDNIEEISKEKRAEEERRIQNPAFRELLREEIASPEFSAAQGLHEWTRDLPPISRNDNLYSNLIEGTKNYLSESDPKDAIPFMVAGLVISAAGIADVMLVDTVSTQGVAANPIVSISQHAAEMVHPAAQSEMLLAINLFVTGLVYQAASETISGAANSGKPPVTAEFAENFARATISKVNGNEINQYLMSMLSQRMETGAITPERAQNYVTMAKLIMLAVALAVSYRAETGWLTGEEFAGIVSGKIGIPEDQAAGEAQRLFQELLRELPPSMREAVLNGLMSYFDSNPDFDQLLEPQKVYSQIYSRIPQADPQG